MRLTVPIGIVGTRKGEMHTYMRTDRERVRWKGGEAIGRSWYEVRLVCTCRSYCK